MSTPHEPPTAVISFLPSYLEKWGPGQGVSSGSLMPQILRLLKPSFRWSRCKSETFVSDHWTLSSQGWHSCPYGDSYRARQLTIHVYVKNLSNVLFHKSPNSNDDLHNCYPYEFLKGSYLYHAIIEKSISYSYMNHGYLPLAATALKPQRIPMFLHEKVLRNCPPTISSNDVWLWGDYFT